MTKSFKTIVLLTVFTAIIFTTRAGFLTLPLDRDEGAYAVMAWQMDHGSQPYRDYFDHKPPGVYGLYMLAFKMFGETFTAIRGFSLLYTVFTMLAVYLFGLKLAGNSAGLWAAGFFSLYQSSVTFQGINANTEVFVLFPMTLAAAFSGGGLWAVFFSGVFSVSACIIKPNMAGVVPAIIILMLFSKRKSGVYAAYAAGILTSFLCFILYLKFAGVLPDFYNDVILYNSVYLEANSHIKGSRLADLSGKFALINIFLVMALIYVFYKTVRNRSYPAVNLIMFILAAAAGIVVLRGIYPHYYLPMLPVLCAAAGYMMSSLMDHAGNAAKKGFIIIAAAALICPFVITEGRNLNKDMNVVSYNQYGKSIFGDAVLVSEFINLTKKENDRLFVWPSDPEIYFYTKIKPPVKSLYIFSRDRIIRGKETGGELDKIFEMKPEFLAVEDIPGDEFTEVFKNSGYTSVMKSGVLSLYYYKPLK